MPGIERLSAAQFSEILVSIADLDPGDYALGVSKMFLKAGNTLTPTPTPNPNPNPSPNP